MRVDLHAHTTASDGLLPPEDLVALAERSGVGVLGVADHDTVEGIRPALAAGERLGVEVIPGVEINCDVEGSEVHILGYFVEHDAPWFRAYLVALRDGRENRAQRMVEKLQGLGVRLSYDRVRALADGAVGRPHVARALVEIGAVTTAGEAFERYIGRAGPAYVERMKVTPADAVRVIRRARGVPVFAHPMISDRDQMIPEMVEAGLAGIEVYYPEQSPEIQKRYLGMCQAYDLVATGGSDFHGVDLATRMPLGSVPVPPVVVERLKARAAEIKGES